MVTEVSSKQQLETLASELRTKSSQLSSDISSIMSMLNGVSDYDGINITQAATTIANNLQTIMSSLNGVVTGISSYASQVSTTDVYGLDSSLSTNSNINDVTQGTGSYGTTGTTGTTGSTGSTGSTGYTGSTGSTGSSGGGYSGGGYSGGGSSNGGSSNSSSGIVPVVPVTPPSSESTDTTPPTESTTPETQTSAQRAEKVVISTGDRDYQMLGKYSNNPELGFNVTTGNVQYELTEKDFDLLCSVVASEGNLSYDESLAVATTVLNRCENGDFISLYGRDPIAQITGIDQFASYGNGEYKAYLNGKAPTEVVNAVKDALAGVRNHDYCSYKANSVTDFSNNMITSSGNRYK